MKRVLGKNDKEYSKEYSNTKPLFGTKGKPPFYDPFDQHVCNWVPGIVSSEEDHKSKYYSNSNAGPKRCIYCKVCHAIKKQFVLKNSVGKTDINVNKDFAKNIEQEIELDINFTNEFPKMNNENEDSVKKHTEGIVKKYENIFLTEVGIFGNYLKIKK